MIGFIISCAGLAGVVVLFSFICEMIENRWNNSWPNRVTADDIRELGRLFDNEK